ncbi:multisubunit potassium/proton antiporter, PhaE subunit [Shimia gijangensis]|uniref:Multisubunit potassium/proton antiporter, PhaE subunit n=1 Tax=Shimia gijangensis TaxID=1470563 RepID=A0A1M6NZF2_9RHOB|nr:Na+/H+ antiporter subunit E [Shimia gijangensis]SHK01034.1 multisubunit potassium/proton antiporter, PhaE subunit [Shimia gijangensis]
MKLIRRIFPHPLLSLLLTIVWLLLVNRFSINSLLFGGFLGIVIPFITRPYWPNMPRIRHPLKIVEYILVVLYDIVVANVVVAKLVLFHKNENLKAAWISVPLELKSPEAITVLAGTITLTPGTVSSDVSSEGHALLVHCLHAPDPDAVCEDIKTRYEGRLKEIFE